MAEMYGANVSRPLDRPNSNALPNPWAPPKPTTVSPASNAFQLSPMGSSSLGMPSFGFPAYPQYYTQYPNQPIAPLPEAQYAEQLASLQEMGFEVCFICSS